MMNELYCMNEMTKELSAIHNCLRYIDEDFLIPIWILAIAVAVIALMFVVMGVATLIATIYYIRMMQKQFNYNKSSIKKVIRKAQRRAKHRKEEMEHEKEAMGEESNDLYGYDHNGI